MITITYTKHFTGGLLAGLSITESLTFAELESAHAWVSSATIGHSGILGTSDYRISDVSYSAS